MRNSFVYILKAMGEYATILTKIIGEIKLYD